MAAFESRTRLFLLHQRDYAGSGLYLAAGATDTEFTDYMHVLADAGKAAGFTIQAHSIQHAGHSWDAVVRGMPDALDFLSARWGIVQ